MLVPDWKVFRKQTREPEALIMCSGLEALIMCSGLEALIMCSGLEALIMCNVHCVLDCFFIIWCRE